MSDYWLISVPFEKNAEVTWHKLQIAVNKFKSCSIYKFYIPELKVGTLDTLLSDADEMCKLEMYLEGLLSRILSSLSNILERENNIPQLRAELVIDGDHIHDYLVSFKWDTAKFPPRQTIKCITVLAQKQALNFENEFKYKHQMFVQARSACDSAAKAELGSLLTKNLSDIVKRKDFLTGSKYISTILVVVPKNLLNDWNRSYETFDDKVIPKSSRMIAEDAEYYLVGVSLFKERIPQFIKIAKTFKFIVRDYMSEEKQQHEQKEHLIKMRIRKHELLDPLVRMIKVNFSELFKSLLHIKASRLFIESVLRYGLPANFRAGIIVVNRKFSKKIRDVLYGLYKHLEWSTNEALGNVEGISVVGHNPTDYYPYVSSKINAEII